MTREQIIRDAWSERGRAAWDPDTHGKGLLPLSIPADAGMGDPGPLGTPIRQYDSLEFRLVRSTFNGQAFVAITCEGHCLEPPVVREQRPPEPVRFVSTLRKARTTRRV